MQISPLLIASKSADDCVRLQSEATTLGLSAVTLGQIFVGRLDAQASRATNKPMLRVKIVNAFTRRNRRVFSVFRSTAVSQAMLACGIQFVGSSPDVLFVGMDDFIDKDVSLEQSIERGVRFVESLDAPVFLFDGSDSTSLVGAYEVFAGTRAWYLFKDALLCAAAYKKPSPLNTWFFHGASKLDLAYDIPESLFDRIRLSGWNFGVFRDCSQIAENAQRSIDVAAVFTVNLKRPTQNHLVRTDTYITAHRMRVWTILRSAGRRLKSVCARLDPATTRAVLSCSRIAISPFGHGEICYRDVEVIRQGCVLVKPTMEGVRTLPAVYRDGATYWSVKPDFSDLLDRVDMIVQMPEEERRAMSLAFRAEYAATYSPNILAHYWSNLLHSAHAR